MKGLGIIVLLFVFFACVDSKNSTKKENKLNASNFNCELEIITNNAPSLALDANSDASPFALVNLTPKKGTFQEQWKIKRLKLNDIQYFTFDNTSFSMDTNVYSNKVRDIALDDSSQRAEIQFESSKGDIIEFIIPKVKITTE